EEYRVTVGHNYGVRLVVERGAELQPRLHDLDWVVAHAKHGAEFVTSDNPLVESESEKFVTFPLAADSALLLLPTDRDKVVVVHKEMPGELIHGTNVETAKASERLTLASNEEYLRRVVRDAGIEGRGTSPFVSWGP